MDPTCEWSLPGMEVILGYEPDVKYLYALTNNQWLFKQNFGSKSLSRKFRAEEDTQMKRYKTKLLQNSNTLSHFIVQVKWGEEFE